MYALVSTTSAIIMANNHMMPARNITELIGGFEIIIIGSIFFIISTILLGMLGTSIIRWIFTGVWSFEF